MQVFLSCLNNLLLLSRFSRVRLCASPQTAAHQAPRPWESPGKNTGVGCRFLLQCMTVTSEGEVGSCPALRDPLTAPDQAPASMGLSRRECWSAVPLPSPPNSLAFPKPEPIFRALSLLLREPLCPVCVMLSVLLPPDLSRVEYPEPVSGVNGKAWPLKAIL